MHTCIDRIGQIYYMIFDAAILSVVPFVALLLRLDGDTSSNYFNVLLNIVRKLQVEIEHFSNQEILSIA